MISTFAKVSKALYEYEERCRDSDLIGYTWGEFLELANDDPVAVGYEIADIAHDLFPDSFLSESDNDKLVSISVAVAQKWLMTLE